MSNLKAETRPTEIDTKIKRQTIYKSVTFLFISHFGGRGQIHSKDKENSS